VRYLIAFLCFASIPVFADELPMAKRKYEIQLSPDLGYSNLSGFNLGLGAALLLPLNIHWQLKFSGEIAVDKWDKTYTAGAGVQYNFSEDWSDSFFAGAGLRFKQVEHHEGNQFSANHYVEFGKHVKLNNSGTISWTPNVTLEGQHKAPATIEVHPLNFSWSF